MEHKILFLATVNQSTRWLNFFQPGGECYISYPLTSFIFASPYYRSQKFVCFTTGGATAVTASLKRSTWPAVRPAA